MKTKFKFILALILLAYEGQAQWSLQAGIGLANPVTGYKTITNSGILYQIDIAKRLHNYRWGMGLMLGWARMHDDNNSSDKFGDARLDKYQLKSMLIMSFPTKNLFPIVA